MKRQVMVSVVALTLVGSALALAQAPKGQGMKRAAGSGAPDKARLQQVLTAWESMDISKPAAFYAKDANLAFYDIAPRKYVDWADYAKGATAMLKDVKSLTLKLNDDAQVHTARNTAWATATVDGVMNNKDGSSLKIDARWTTVWENRGGNWLIVHDHFSLPLPEPPPKK